MVALREASKQGGWGKGFRHWLANIRAIQELAGVERGGGDRQIRRFMEIVEGDVLGAKRGGKEG